MSQYAQDISDAPGDTPVDRTDADAQAARADDAPATPRTNPRWGAPIGVVAGLLGLLPWLITGMRVPLQNLWATEVLPRDMPTAWLPFSQYALVLLIGLLVTGGAAAGLAARLIRARTGRRGVPAMFLALIVVQLVALTQTFLAVKAGLVQGTMATVYLWVVTGVAVLAILTGAAAFWLIARAPRAGALVGFAIGAVAVQAWLDGLIHPFGVIPTGSAAAVGLWLTVNVLAWVPAVLIGVAIGWCGIRSVGRAIAAVVSLALLWFAPALSTAIGAGAGSRVVRGDLDAMVATALQMLRTQALAPAVTLLPMGVCLAAAAVAWWAWRHRRVAR